MIHGSCHGNGSDFHRKLRNSPQSTDRQSSGRIERESTVFITRKMPRSEWLRERTRHPRVIRSGCGNRDQLLRQTVRMFYFEQAEDRKLLLVQQAGCRACHAGRYFQLSAFRERMPHQQTRNGRSRKLAGTEDQYYLKMVPVMQVLLQTAMHR